ncbi:MAG: hypothetical protein E7414_00990 [Ruminococcaceae bacterium]|nr:hypothetical protein [Oscillospiraceae bacterium]
MKKSVYSLVLTDTVIAAADQLAYVRGMSRSALIDELLAQSLSCMTPEMRMRDIFMTLEERIREDAVFRLQSRASDSILFLHSAIQYKYKPTIRYSVELYRRVKDGAFGELKIQSRTQNEQLLSELTAFYRLWIATERRLSGNRNIQFFAEDGKLMRLLTFPEHDESYSESELGEAIGAYIRTFDRAMKLYFSRLPDKQEAAEQIARLYTGYLQGRPPVLV